jgi:hypothetical protein
LFRIRSRVDFCFRLQYNIEIGGGLGELAGKIWRIGLVRSFYFCDESSWHLIFSISNSLIENYQMGVNATESCVSTVLAALKDALEKFAPAQPAQ